MRARHFLATVSLLGCTCLPAQAENRLFVVANNADGYGVDRCLAAGAPCGRAIATAYCQSKDFQIVVSYRKVEREQMTGLVLASTEQVAGNEGALVAIECGR
jgi:hypothetical protein